LHLSQIFFTEARTFMVIPFWTARPRAHGPRLSLMLLHGIHCTTKAI
jgi:hypothetical protein